MIIALFSIALTGCPKNPLEKDVPEPKPSDIVLARVNGVPITELDFNIRLLDAGLSPGKFASLNEKRALKIREKLLGDLIDRKLLILAATDLKLAIEDAELEAEQGALLDSAERESIAEDLDKFGVSQNDWRAAMREKLLTIKVAEAISSESAMVTQAEIEDFLLENPGFGTSVEGVVFRQIFSAKQEVVAQAEKKLEAGEDFGEVAARMSEAPEKDSGGKVGPLPIKDLPESLAEQIKKLAPGKRSEPFQSVYGWHIIELIEHKPAEQLDKDKVNEKVRRLLREAKKGRALNKWMKQKRQDSNIELYESESGRINQDSPE